MKTPFNKFIYYGFILLAAYDVFFLKDYSNGTIYLGLSLAFDPFDTEKPWKDRPMWQKIWLIVHLACVAFLFGLMIGLGDRAHH